MTETHTKSWRRPESPPRIGQDRGLTSLGVGIRRVMLSG